MKIKYALVPAGLLLLTTAVAAQITPPYSPSPPSSQTGIHCEDFKQLPNGAWTPVRKVTITGPRGPFTVEPGIEFGLGPSGHASMYDLKVGRVLNDQCR